MNSRFRIKPLNRKGRRAKAKARTLEQIANALHNKYKKEFEEIVCDAIIFGLTEDQVAERVRSVMSDPSKSTQK